MQFSFDHISFTSNYHTPKMHRHFAKHLIFSVDGMLKCKIDDTEFECRGVIIQSNILHTVGCDKPPMLVCLIDETCNRARKIDELYLKNKTFFVLDDSICDAVCKTLQKYGGIENCDDEIMKICYLNGDGIAKYDQRITTVLEIINKSEIIEVGAVSELGKTVFLSESRLSHLFREQVGISLSGYLLFSKLAKAYSYMSVGENIKTAAIHAGFSSSAHFASVNKKHFGISACDVGSKSALFISAEK